MPRAGLGPGNAPARPNGPGRPTHAERIERLRNLPRDKWTPADKAAWLLEEKAFEMAESLVKQAKRGNVKALDLAFRLMGTPELRPGAGVQVNVGVNAGPTRFIVEEVRSGQVLSLREPEADRLLPESIEGECVEVEAEQEGE